jgi:hypothetical protein
MQGFIDREAEVRGGGALVFWNDACLILSRFSGVCRFCVVEMKSIFSLEIYAAQSI